MYVHAGGAYFLHTFECNVDNDRMLSDSHKQVPVVKILTADLTVLSKVILKRYERKMFGTVGAKSSFIDQSTTFSIESSFSSFRMQWLACAHWI